MQRGGRTTRTKTAKNLAEQLELTKKHRGDMSETDAGEQEHADAKATDMIRTGLEDIVKEIQDFKSELKTELTTFKEEIKKRNEGRTRGLYEKC